MDQNQGSYQPHNAAYYRARGREMLTNNWWIAILAVLLLGILAGSSEIAPLSFSFNFDTSSVDSQNVPSGFFAFVLLAVTGTSALLFAALHFFVGAPVRLGYQRFSLNLADGKNAGIEDLFAYFKLCYGKSLLLNLLHILIRVVLSLPAMIGSLLFSWIFVVNVLLLNSAALLQDGVEAYFSVISAQLGVFFIAVLILLAGVVITVVLNIVIGYRVCFAHMILAEYPEIGAVDALRNSANLMRGKIWRLFCLQFSFIGWYLLLIPATVLTCGLGALGTFPLQVYVNASVTAFYDDIANRTAAKEAEFPSIDPDDYIPGGDQSSGTPADN